MPSILALDQGTTSTRAIVFDDQGRPRATAQEPLKQSYPQSGWVEHDPEEIWRATLSTARAALTKAGVAAKDVAALGITNQRETTIIWERATGKPIHPAIVWQDRRTAEWCRARQGEGLARPVQERTGLLLDPYFSASKIAWILDAVPGARARAERGDLAFGTVDCFLIWRLTGGKVHATDATNASRTMLFDIARGCWDEELCARLCVPKALLPAVRDCADDYGATEPAQFGAAIAIRGVAGDQQAAALGQACVRAGMVKVTYGTGAFALLHTGATIPHSRNRLLATVAWRLGGKLAYALEGSVFNAGTVVQWLRDGLHALPSAAESEAICASTPMTGGVHLVPAFTGLGAPWWDPDARGAIVGLGRDSTRDQIVRAGIESVAYQTADLFGAMRADGAPPPAVVRVDGGMAANRWFLQFLADVLGAAVERPESTETTAWGAAWLAGMRAGVYPGLDGIESSWRMGASFAPAMAAEKRAELLAGWRRAVERVRG